MDQNNNSFAKFRKLSFQLPKSEQLPISKSKFYCEYLKLCNVICFNNIYLSIILKIIIYEHKLKIMSFIFLKLTTIKIIINM